MYASIAALSPFNRPEVRRVACIAMTSLVFGYLALIVCGWSFW